MHVAILWFIKVKKFKNTKAHQTERFPCQVGFIISHFNVQNHFYSVLRV